MSAKDAVKAREDASLRPPKPERQTKAKPKRIVETGWVAELSIANTLDDPAPADEDPRGDE
jgi:hypothetical protein